MLDDAIDISAPRLASYQAYHYYQHHQPSGPGDTNPTFRSVDCQQCSVSAWCNHDHKLSHSHSHDCQDKISCSTSFAYCSNHYSSAHQYMLYLLIHWIVQISAQFFFWEIENERLCQAGRRWMEWRHTKLQTSYVAISIWPCTLATVWMHDNIREVLSLITW